ncbi:N-acetyltransferase 8-like [Lingula anatina]|uniref:N-acetyltransferase 8-like n=1 Tax=Lingula anatina TaxID=7574 RepID=A0A1S3HXG4_LINAN|nr:N-acetyltransferase 8-like [Lingula anatina]|eukprot:XP_013390720.1 N-acetyltransferase 8-like [Lingula anatina]
MYAYYNSGQRGRRFWVAEHDGVIIGATGIQEQQMAPVDKSGERRGTVAVLKRMAVESAYRRMGVAKALLDTAIEFAKEQCYDVMVLYTIEVQFEATCFYLKHGFEKKGVTPCDTVFPLLSFDLLNLRLDLNKIAQ